MQMKRAFTLIELLIVCAIISILSGIALNNFADADVRAKVARVKADMRTLTTAVESYCVDHNTYPIRRYGFPVGCLNEDFCREYWECQPQDETTQTAVHHAPFYTKILDPREGLTSTPVGLHVLTTPVAYITMPPSDVFNIPARLHQDDALVWGGCCPTEVWFRSASDAIDYYDPVQTDRWVGTVTRTCACPNRGRGYMLTSVGPDQSIGLTYERFGLDPLDPHEKPPLGFPPESPFTRGTEIYMYDPTNGTISTGNIYRFSGGLGQADILPPQRDEPPPEMPRHMRP